MVKEDVVGVLKKYFACLTRVHVCTFVLPGQNLQHMCRRNISNAASNPLPDRNR